MKFWYLSIVILVNAGLSLSTYTQTGLEARNETKTTIQKSSEKESKNHDRETSTLTIRQMAVPGDTIHQGKAKTNIDLTSNDKQDPAPANSDENKDRKEAVKKPAGEKITMMGLLIRLILLFIDQA